MAIPPRRPWYARWWYFWIAIAIGISLWWVFIFGGILLFEQVTETGPVDRDGVIVQNETTTSDNQTLLLNETV